MRRLLDRSAFWIASIHTWRVLLVLYMLVVLVVSAPVLLKSVAGDDSYWLLQVPTSTHGSFWQAFWDPVAHAFDFSGTQARSTALAVSERRVLALATFEISKALSIPPFIMWAGVKITLLIVAIGCSALFLRSVKFRSKDAQIRGLNDSSVAFILLALPLAIALGVKAQDIGSLNGWNHYPTLAYGAFPFCLGVATLGLRASVLLERNYRRWVGPAVVGSLLTGFLLNLCYELVAVSVPLTLLALLLHPLPDAERAFDRWRPKATIAIALVAGYAAVFGWIRWEISQMACHATNSCYPGSIIKLDPHTLYLNFRGSLPGGTSDFVLAETHGAGRHYPGPGWFSVSLALAGVILFSALWASWRLRDKKLRISQLPIDDARGLVVVALVGLGMAVGATAISGITAQAVEQVTSPVLSYRTNVVTWTALTLALVALIRLMVRTRWRVVRVTTIALSAAFVVTCIGLFFPRNLSTAQINRVHANLVDSIHREVMLGDLSPAGDLRRCTALTTAGTRLPKAPNRETKTIDFAYISFEYLYGVPYCSTKARSTRLEQRLGTEPHVEPAKTNRFIATKR